MAFICISTAQMKSAQHIRSEQYIATGISNIIFLIPHFNPFQRDTSGGVFTLQPSQIKREPKRTFSMKQSLSASFIFSRLFCAFHRPSRGTSVASLRQEEAGNGVAGGSIDGMFWCVFVCVCLSVCMFLSVCVCESIC